MNANAALFTGMGSAARTPAGGDAGPATGNRPTGPSDEPDFFTVLTGTIAEGRDSSSSALQADTSEPLSELEEYIRSQGHLDAELPAPGEVDVDLEIPIEIDTRTLEAEWLAPSDNERDDRIPLLEIDVPNSESRLPLYKTEAAGHAESPLQPLDPALLAGTHGNVTPTDITFASPTLSLGATIGDENRLVPVSGTPATPTADGTLAATVGSGEGSAPIVPAVIADPDLSLVDPELRTRVERVIDRMRTEYGHNVKVVEGFRTEARQEALFAQGRTVEGPVVTWTQNSMHSQGLAVDVVVDGSYAPHEGYRRLARIAAEEGLESLGAKDPGHLQLVRTSTDADGPADRIARIAQVQTPAAPEAIAPVADVAQVAARSALAEPAPVALTATVAAPAAVALPGESGPRATDPVPVVEAPQLAQERSELTSTDGDQVAETLVELGTPGAGRRSSDELPFGQDPRNRGLIRAALRRELRGRGGSETAATNSTGEADPRLAATNRTEQNGQPLPTVKAPSVTAAESLHRVTQVRELQELAYPRRLGQVTLRMLDGMSEEARMRVSLMGDGVSTSIGVRDLAQADRMRSRIGTLENALRMRGLEPAATRVTAIGTPTGAEAAALTHQAVTGARFAGEADPFLSWQSGSDAGTGRDDQDGTPNQREDSQRPGDNYQPQHEQKQENPR